MFPPDLGEQILLEPAQTVLAPCQPRPVEVTESKVDLTVNVTEKPCLERRGTRAERFVVHYLASLGWKQAGRKREGAGSKRASGLVRYACSGYI